MNSGNTNITRKDAPSSSGNTEIARKDAPHSSGSTEFACKVTPRGDANRSGAFLINRTAIKNSEPATSDWPHRILRWAKDGFHPCQVDQTLIDPSGIAADPLSTDLYVIEGALIASASPKLQRLLRLTRTGPDAYAVQIVATHFGKLSACGIGFSADGRRLVLTDRGNRVIVVLKRK